MALLFSHEILGAVNEELRSAQKSVQIITAYCKEDSIRNIECEISPDVAEKKIMVRFRLDDLVKGSSDFSILQFCMEKGWDIYIRFDLHAKTYVVDNKRGIVSSANVTKSGLSNGSSGNVEMGTLVNIELQDIEKINGLYRDAIRVDERIFRLFKTQYESIDNSVRGKTMSWNEEIVSLFNPRVDNLFSHELPDSGKLIDGEYIGFLEMIYSENKKEVKEAFRWSNVYKWLLTILKENDGCLSFGEITNRLHNALVADPKPYRKDVKIQLSNLLSLIQELEMEEIEIDKPNYAQRIRLRQRGEKR